MSNLAYLLVAVAFSLVASLAVWYRNHQPRSLESRIDEFQRELQALAPEQGAGVAPPPRSPDSRAT